MENIWKNPGRALPLNFKNRIDGLELLAGLRDEAVKICFFDPQYRGLLDKLAYGNRGAGRGRRSAGLRQMSFEIIEDFLREIERVLRPSGYLFLWVDKFHLVEGVSGWFAATPGLQCVDLITWDKQKIGMGYRTRRRAEYLIVIQKAPKAARKTWRLHTIPDVWSEKTGRAHPHSKPVGLQTRLLEATAVRGDLICDPAAGGYSVLDCCVRLGLDFIGGDIEFGADPRARFKLSGQ